MAINYFTKVKGDSFEFIAIIILIKMLGGTTIQSVQSQKNTVLLFTTKVTRIYTVFKFHGPWTIDAIV